MGTHMKTTIEIADDLLDRAKRKAKQENKTLREIIEDALRHQLTSKSTKSFRLKRHSFKGKGLKSSVIEGKWETIRDRIYGIEQ
jgi:hypothetical protein